MTPETIAILNLLTTIALCIITLIYVIVTYRIQRDQRNNFQISNRPYLSFEIVRIAAEKKSGKVTGLQVQLVFKNVGNVLLEYTIESYDFIVNNTTGTNTYIKNNVGVVFPGTTTTFYFPIEQTFNNSFLQKDNPIVINYKLTYKRPTTNEVFVSQKTLELNYYRDDDSVSAVIYTNQRET